MTTGNGLPPDFTPGWPETPEQCKVLVDAIRTEFGSRRGKHWALQVFGKNPISGYKIIIKQCTSNDP